MIKIIKRGTKEEKECEKCGCIFSFDEKEDTILEDTMHLGIKIHKEYIKCPQCGYEIILSAIR